MFKKQTLITLLVIILVIGSISFGAVMYSENKTYKNYLQAQYQMNLYNLLENVKNMQVSLAKATISQTPNQRALLFEEISRQAMGAKSDLHNLPLAHDSISQTSKFLAQVSDYTYTLTKNRDNVTKIDSKTENTIEELKSYSAYLTLQLQALEREISHGNFNWEQIREQGVQSSDGEVKDKMDIKFQNISNEMQSYPNLIYDGPFSDKALNIKPKILSEKVVPKETALQSAKKSLGQNNVQSIKVTGEVKNNSIPAYSITAKLKNQKNSYVNMNISKNGGKLIYMLNHRDIGKETLSIKEAIDKGKKYIEANGYPKMIPLFALKYDGIAVINYVYVKDNVVIYSDQLKLKVALDNGDVVGVEAGTYLKDHSESRNIPSPKVDLTKYQSEIAKKLDIKNIRLALIPVDSTKEVLCYEYVAEKNGEKYIIYINALTGEEVNILKVVETSNGELSM